MDYARVDVNQRDDSNHTPLSWCVLQSLFMMGLDCRGAWWAATKGAWSRR